MERDDENDAYHAGAGQFFGDNPNAGQLMDIACPGGSAANFDAQQDWTNNPYLIPADFDAASKVSTSASTANAFGTCTSQFSQFLPINSTNLDTTSTSLLQTDAASWPVSSPTMGQTFGLVSPRSLASTVSFMSPTIHTPMSESWDHGQYEFPQMQAADSPRERIHQHQESKEKVKKNTPATRTEKSKKSRKKTSTAAIDKKAKGSTKEATAATLPTPQSSSPQDAGKDGPEKSSSKGAKAKSNKRTSKRSKDNVSLDAYDEYDGGQISMERLPQPKSNAWGRAQNCSDGEDAFYDNVDIGDAENQGIQPTQRERNRMAATKCRAKTKVAIATLEEDERNMSAEWSQLSQIKDALHNEALMLKTQLLAHVSACTDCTDLRNYVRNAAHHIGNTRGQNPIWGADGTGAEWTELEDPGGLSSGRRGPMSSSLHCDR